MAISQETLKAIARDYSGLELSDEEMAVVLPEIESYLAEVETLRELDLSQVMSSRLLKAEEGQPNG